MPTASKPRVQRAYPSFIAGLGYRSPGGLDRRAYCAKLPIGAEIELVAEPDNDHDSDAVALIHAGNHIGYIPQKHDWVHRALEEGDTLMCVVQSIELEENDPRLAGSVGLAIGILDGPVAQRNPPASIAEPVIESARPPKTNWTALLACLAIVAAVIGGITYWAVYVRYAPDTAMLARMIPRQDECRKLFAEMRRLGVATSTATAGEGAAIVYVNEALWNGSDTMTSLTNSLTFWCAVTPPSGYFTVTVRNSKGENIMRIKNGHVAPWF